jgi:uncharacterized RDD family membrane protein YckC
MRQMKQSTLITFSIFIFSQIMFGFLSYAYDTAAPGEMLTFAALVCPFLLLHFAGFRWARWVVTAEMGLLIFAAINIAFDGFGFAFLGVACLCVAVIIMMFAYPPPARRATEKKNTDTEVQPMLGMDAAHKPVVVNSFSVENDVYHYPLLVKRYQCVLIDGMLLFFTMVVTMVILGDSPYRQPVMVSLGILFALGYEPILTAYSATIGQRMMGIRVRQIDNPALPINIVQAYVRVIVKWLLGWLSFVTINFSPAHRAVHDMAGKSVVIRVK